MPWSQVKIFLQNDLRREIFSEIFHTKQYKGIEAQWIEKEKIHLWDYSTREQSHNVAHDMR